MASYFGSPTNPSTVAHPGTSKRSLVESERRLIDRCVSGECNAWDELYERYHRRLCRAIQSALGPGTWDGNLVDEIAARVWYALVANDAQLLDRFDPERGVGLQTYLALIAKSQANVLFRSEQRRKKREQVASRDVISVGHDPELWAQGDFDCFLAKLSPREREFVESRLNDSERRQPMQDLSEANLWQIASRVRRKLREFLADN